TRASASAVEPGPGGGGCPWLSAALPVASRVRLLEAAMTRADREALLRLDWGFGGGDAYEGSTPAIPSLCIPEITEQDGSAGVGSGWRHAPPGKFAGATQLPDPIVDAAAFNPDLALAYGRVVGREDAATGIDAALAPTVNIERDPLWGRAYESLGEDPYLSATLGTALVKGIQSERVVSVLKHFAAYNQETNRGTTAADVMVGQRTLREIYLPAFAAGVQEGHAGGVMCSYSLINRVPSCQYKALLTGILRREWHFGGFIRSDCGSVFSQRAAVRAGLSQVKCGEVYDADELAAAVQHGALTRTEMNRLLTPLLTTLLDKNLIADPHPRRPTARVSSAADRSVALRTANEGAVLLKNDGILPLHLDRLSSVALIGDDGGTPMPAGFGASHVDDPHPITALQALGAKLGRRLSYAPASDLRAAVEVARRAKVAIVVVHDFEAEGHDRTSLSLPGTQDYLVRAVEAANRRTIVVLETGAPVLMPWLSNSAAVLETWYPGHEAGASLVDLLSGAADPSGKLPVTWPASETARPDVNRAYFGGVGGRIYYRDGIDVGYRWYEAHHVRPAFAFGDGLSYTTFGYAGLSLSPRRGGGIRVTALVRNDGRVAGADVVQCYVGDPAKTGEPPRQLRGFVRVDLEPGQVRRVTMMLTPGDLAYWSTARGQWVMAAGRYRVWVGDGSDPGHLPVHGSLYRPAKRLGVDSGPAPSASV
ncbi:MAG: glycoside hydrolase family 3 C-terminal domain-containing protein, partial [Acidimicrobiaceae bacterium]|nr:glycoside hydrolase family 3 C-terminal domain-containing protein [Acidimicrobiaceae bacterium]